MFLYSFVCVSSIRTLCKLLSLSIKMKNLIFVTWLYLQISLVQCHIFVNNLNGWDAAPLKMCIQKTIKHLFSENDTLNLLLNGGDLCEDAIFEMNTMRPYLVLNMDDINDVNKLQYDGQFIICPKDTRSLYVAMRRASVIAERNMRSMGNSKILVITNIIYTSWMFNIFWCYGINNVIILVYGQGTTKLFTCNRFAPENECAKTPKLITHHDCEEQLSFSFTSVIHQMNKCPVTFWFLSGSSQQYENLPTSRVIQYIVEELSHRLNATFQRNVIKNWQEYYYLINTIQNIILIGIVPESLIGVFDVTKSLNKADVVWLVPKARQISNMNVCLKVFNSDVWIATSIVFICTWLMWCLIISRNGGFTFDKLCRSFLNVWSLTIFGNVPQLPRHTSLALRIILLFYLIYAINMQFAFTSDMSTVLTAPQYEFQIRNLEQLADSRLPIYTVLGLKDSLFNLNMTDRKLYTKLQNLIHSVKLYEFVDCQVNLHLHRNYAVITSLEDIHNAEKFTNKKVEAYKITDDSITPGDNSHLQLHIDHYFTTTLNTFVNEMIESGIHQKHKNDFYHELNAKNVDTTPADDLITLKHLVFIFVFFGFGVFTACVVFCFELVLNKYL